MASIGENGARKQNTRILAIIKGQKYSAVLRC
jgi:hypothetical protein